MKIHSERIDFLRGVAIFLVFIYHASLVYFGPEYQFRAYNGFFVDFNEYSSNEILQNFLPSAYGWCGVELFLVISGFLIHSAYLREKKFNPVLFFNKRFWRIWPPYILTLVFFAVAFKSGWFDFLIHAVLLNNLLPQTFHSINGSFWSLALEFQLYLIYPLFIYLRNRFGLNFTFIAILSVQIIATAIEFFCDLNSYYPYHFSIFKFWIIWVMGAFLAEKYNSGERTIHLKSLYLVLFLLLLMSLRLTILFKYFRHLLFSVFFMLLLEKVLHAKNTKLYEGKLFSFFVTLGICSYSLYLLHQPYLGSFIEKLWIVENVGFGIAALVGTFFFLFIVSYASYRIVELPSIRYGKKIYNIFQQKKNRLQVQPNN